MAWPEMQYFNSIGHLPRRDRLLLKAVEQRDLAAVQRQLTAGANPSAADDKGLTALHVAAALAEGRMVEVLLDAGADESALAQPKQDTHTQNSPSVEKLTPLSYMATHIGKSGAGTAVPHLCSRHCITAAAIVQQLVTAGAQVAVRDGLPPLLHAAQAGCPTLVAALLQAGADPGSTTPQGYTMLHAAAAGGNREVVLRLRGALGSIRSMCLCRTVGTLSSSAGSLKSTPLHLAAAGGHPEVAEALVAAGASPEQRDQTGDQWNNTPLLKALKLGHYHLVPLLVTPGSANKGLSDDMPLHLAAAQQWQQAQGMQQQAAAAAAAARAANALLAAGADPNAVGRLGLTPLETAAVQGRPEVLQVLLEHVVQQRVLQQRQQAGQPQLLLALLQQLGVHALKAGNGSTWRFLVTLAADTGGPEGVRTMWSGIKQQLQGQPPGVAGSQAGTQATSILDAWVDCWVAACRDLAAQRSKVTDRLEQLVVAPHQQQQQQPSSHSHHHEQQQQQGGCGAAGPPKLACKLQLLVLQQEQLTPAPTSSAAGTHATTTSTSSSSSSSTTAAPSGTSHTPPAASQLGGLGAAAAGGSEEEAGAPVGQMPDGMAAATMTCAASMGLWERCVGGLRALVMLDEAKGRAAVQDALASASSQNAQQQQRQLQVCDALLADWLDLRQQQQRELKEAVVAAAKAAAGAACL